MTLMLPAPQVPIPTLLQSPPCKDSPPYLMIQEKFSQETKMLTVDLAEMSIDFEDGDVVFAINLISRRLRIPAAFGHVTLENPPTFHVFQAKLADEQLRESGIFLRVRRRVPSER